MNNKSRTRKALVNISTSMIYQITAIICGLITPRLILTSFGSTYNGVITSASQFLSMISLLTLGITGATRVALYKTLANNDENGTNRIMKATTQYMRRVGYVIVVYAIILSFVYPIISHNELSRSESGLIVLIVGLGTFAEYFFGISDQTLLQADQSNYVSNILNIIKTVFNTIVVALLIKLNFSIFIVKLGSSVVFLICPIILHFYVKRKYGLSNKCEPDNSAIKARGSVAIHSIANFVHNNTDLVILTIFTDAKLISVFTVFYLVVGKVKSIMQVFTSGMEAAFGNMWVKKEFDSLTKNFNMYEYLLYSFTIIVFSCVGVLILPFIKIYTAGVNDVNYVRLGLAILITLAEGMYCLREPYVTLVYATGSYSETKQGALIEAFINIIISIVLVWRIGIEGVLIGTFIANTFRTIQFSIFVSRKILHRPFTVVIYKFLWLLLTSGVGVAISLLIIHWMGEPSTWIHWVLCGFACFSCMCIVTIFSSLIFYRKLFMGVFKKVFSL